MRDLSDESADRDDRDHHRRRDAEFEPPEQIERTLRDQVACCECGSTTISQAVVPIQPGRVRVVNDCPDCGHRRAVYQRAAFRNVRRPGENPGDGAEADAAALRTFGR